MNKILKKRLKPIDNKNIDNYLFKNKLAKGGQILAYKADLTKFKKIGNEDKYIIEAITEIGLQNTKFDKDSIVKTIESEFQKLLQEANTNEYIISEDSNEITRQMQFDIDARYLNGETDENIAQLKRNLEIQSERNEYIDKYAKTQNNLFQNGLHI